MTDLLGMSFADFWWNIDEGVRDIGWEKRKAILEVKAGLLVMLVGPRGGGKTTAADWFVQESKESNPEVPRISNVPITGAIYIPDILRFLAAKLVAEGGEKNYDVLDDNTVLVKPRETVPSQMLIIIDEAAISGFESRGSGLFALNSYLLALSRKLNVDIILISQLMSMVEKRGQWLADYYWLCEARFFPGTKVLDYFRYRVYNEEYRKTREYKMTREMAEEFLFGKFDTFDIPNWEELKEGFTYRFDLTEEDFAMLEDIKAGRKHQPMKAPLPTREEMFLSRKALRSPYGRVPGETVLKDGKRYEVLQRDWNFDEGQYQYRVKEIPNNLPLGIGDVEPEEVAA